MQTFFSNVVSLLRDSKQDGHEHSLLLELMLSNYMIVDKIT